MEIDGVQRKAKDVRGYEQEDDEDKDLKRRSQSKGSEDEERANDD